MLTVTSHRQSLPKIGLSKAQNNITKQLQTFDTNLQHPVKADSISLSGNTPKFAGANDSLETDQEQLNKLKDKKTTLNTAHSQKEKDYQQEKNKNDGDDKYRQSKIDEERKKGYFDKIDDNIGAGFGKSIEEDGGANVLTLFAPAMIRGTFWGVKSAFGNSETLKDAEKKPLANRSQEKQVKQEVDRLWGQLQAIIEQHDELQPKVAKGNDTLNTLTETIALARQAIDPSPFQDEHYQAVYHGLRQTPYREVESSAKSTVTHLSKIPRAADAYRDATGDTWREDGVAELLKDLRSHNPNIQALALKRLYPLEGGRPKESKAIYPEFLKQGSPKVAKTALEMMTQHPAIRLQEEAFNTVLVEFLNSGNAVKTETALNTIEQLAMKDPAIDTTLKQLAHPKSSLTSALRTKAITLWNQRREMGLVEEKNPEKDAQKMADSLVGNQEMVSKLKVLLGNYYHAQENTPDSITPGLIMYLPGKSGIGKTTLVNQAQAVLSADKKDLIHIKPKNITADNDLAKMLRSTTPANKDGLHDLSGKILFFDEFQGVNSIRQDDAKLKFLEDMKDLFAVDKADVKSTQEWLKREKFILKNPVMAIASNDPLSTVSIRGLDNSQGEALLDRLSQVTRSSSANRLELSNDLTQHVSEFVKQFGPKQYFQNIEQRNFAGPLTLTPAAQRVLTQNLNKEIKETEGRVSGRKLALWMVEDINSAIKETEERTRQQFLRTTVKDAEGNPKSIVSQALKIDADSTGKLKVQG